MCLVAWAEWKYQNLLLPQTRLANKKDDADDDMDYCDNVDDENGGDGYDDGPNKT